MVATQSSKTIDLSVDGAAQLFSDISCLTSAAQIQIASGDSSNTFYIKNSSEESVSITATDAEAVLVSDSHVMNFANELSWADSAYNYRTRIIVKNLESSSAFKYACSY